MHHSIKWIQKCHITRNVSLSFIQESCEALSAYLPSTLNPYITNVTAAAKLCSSMLCQNNGRCVRKNPQSDAYLHLNPNHFNMLKVQGKYLAVGMPSLSDISNFVYNFTCQCYAGQKCSATMPESLPTTPLVIAVWLHICFDIWNMSFMYIKQINIDDSEMFWMFFEHL